MMTRNWIRAKLYRHGFKFYLCSLLFCICIMFLLTVCNNSVDTAKINVERGLRDNDEVKPVRHVDIESYDIASEVKNRPSKHLVVFVMSAPSHQDSRNLIRQTWALNLPKDTFVYFVIGTGSVSAAEKKSLIIEDSKYKDLVLLKEFSESYFSLTEKLIETLKWADENLKLDYFMKVDEDTFVRLDEVVKELNSKPKKLVYWGFFDGRAHVKKTGKWAEKDFVLCDRYLPYALGGGYVLSHDLVHYLAINSDMFQLLNNEDVSLGMWLAPLKIQRIHDPNFNTEFKSRGCFNSYIVMHKQSVDDMRQLNHSLHVNGRLCEVEHRIRLSYNYNWEDFPTNCCIRKDPSIPWLLMSLR